MRGCSATDCSKSSLQNSTYCFEHYKQLRVGELLKKDHWRRGCPPDLAAFIMDHLQEVEKIAIARLTRSPHPRSYQGVGALVKRGRDAFRRWEAVSVGKEIMTIIQLDMDGPHGTLLFSDPRCIYKVTVTGWDSPAGNRIRLQRSKHIDMHSSAKEWAVNNG